MTATCPNENHCRRSAPATRQARFPADAARDAHPAALHPRRCRQRPSRPRPSRTTRRGTCARPHRRVHPALPPTPANGRTIHCLADPTCGRKVRYRGIARNRIGFSHRCAAINLRRLIHPRLGLGRTAGNSPPGPDGFRADKQGTTPTGTSPSNAADSPPLNIDACGRLMPGTQPHETPAPNLPCSKRRLAQQTLKECSVRVGRCTAAIGAGSSRSWSCRMRRS